MPHRNPFAWLVVIGICCSIAGMSRALTSASAVEASTPAPRASAEVRVATVATAPPTPVVTEASPPAPVASAITTPESAVRGEVAVPDATVLAAPQASAPEPAPASTVGTLTAAVAPPVPALLFSNSAKAGQLLDLMNAARIEAGLAALESDTALADVALTRARNLINNGYFDHYSADGESAFSELASRGIGYRLAGENLARNNYIEPRTVRAAFDALMASPGHRANILEPRFASAGLAAVESGSMWVYVMVFKD